MSCPFNQCDGSGYVHVEDEDGRYWTNECRCLVVRRQQARIERLFEAARVPRRYQGKHLENFDPQWQRGAWQIARRFVDRFDELRAEGKNGICFMGTPGTGKTHLAYGILQSLLARGVPGICGSVPDLLDLLRPAGPGDDRRQAEAAERLELLKHADLVALDDLGAERSTEWATERLYVILNARYSDQLATVITTNVLLEDLEGLPGWGRIVSRLFEMCHLVRLDGPDYRKEGGMPGESTGGGPRRGDRPGAGGSRRRPSKV